MIDRFTVWQYRDTANCWDYVREFLIDKTDITNDDIPRFGVHPDDMEGKGEAADSIKGGYVVCGPQDFAIACHYFGKALVHVGIVYNGMVWHTSRRWGTTKHKIKDFERIMKTEYRIHRKLWQG